MTRDLIVQLDEARSWIGKRRVEGAGRVLQERHVNAAVRLQAWWRKSCTPCI